MGRCRLAYLSFIRDIAEAIKGRIFFGGKLQLLSLQWTKRFLCLWKLAQPVINLHRKLMPKSGFLHKALVVVVYRGFLATTTIEKTHKTFDLMLCCCL
jgi:hypothetical protein